MPNIKPLTKIVNTARTLRDGHRERHRATGFGFALADSVDYLDGNRWDTLTSDKSIFMSRRYLRVLESAGPDNLRQRYAMIFRGSEPIGAVAAQTVRVSVARARKDTKHKRLTAPLEHLDEQMLVCGNLMSWGMHGVAFADHQDPTALWSAVAEALYRIRRADKLLGSTDLVMVKDISNEDAAGQAAMKRFSYRALETDPNMVLKLSPQWRRFEDYLASLTSKYRKQLKDIDKDVAAAGCTVEELKGADEIARHALTLHGLYLQTHHNARLRLVTLPVEFLPRLAANLGEDVKWTVVSRGNEILGFVNTVRDGRTAVGYYIGFDREANSWFPIYFRLLQSVVDHAISFGCERLSLGRTALEPKARLGAKPEPMRVLIRHRIPLLNVLVRGLLHTVSHDEAPERNPFK